MTFEEKRDQAGSEWLTNDKSIHYGTNVGLAAYKGFWKGADWARQQFAWKTIDTAEKINGNEVLGWFPDTISKRFICYWVNDTWYARDTPLNAQPTHWMPLPEDPSTSDVERTNERKS